MVTSNSVDTNVTELSEENKKLIHNGEASSSTRKLVDETQGFPINKWNSNDMPAVWKVDECSYKISKLMTRLLRLPGRPRVSSRRP